MRAAFRIWYFWCALCLATAHAAYTVEQRVAQFGPAVESRLAPYFAAAKVPYPPKRLVLVGLKQEKQLQLYASGPNGALHFIRSYPILAASGGPGPKLRQGDCQVPEGLYRIESLNPNSRFHLSLRVNYPNTFDRARARVDGRSRLGGDIMIHGNCVSIGCLAMGDRAAEDLFVLAAKTGLQNIELILAPADFRRVRAVTYPGAPSWLPTLYEQIRLSLRVCPLPLSP